MQEKSANTAWGPVFQVAIEQLQPINQRLFTDSYAIPLLPVKWKLFIYLLRISFFRNIIVRLMDKKVPGARAGVLCRKRYIDETIMKYVNTDIDSILILGSGFDTLAYRTPEISLKSIFELDFPNNIAEKKYAIKRLKAQQHKQVRFIPIDFNTQEIEPLLIKSGYSFNHKTFVVLEGVTQYITESSFQKLLSFLSKLKSGSMIILTYILKDFMDGKNLYDLGFMYNRVRIESQIWKLGFYPDEIHSTLKDYDWSVIEDICNNEYQERYIKPTGRKISAMEIERAILAIKK